MVKVEETFPKRGWTKIKPTQSSWIRFLKQDWEEKAVVLTIQKQSLHLPQAQRRKIASDAFWECKSQSIKADVCKGHPSWLRESWAQNEISEHFFVGFPYKSYLLGWGHVIFLWFLPNKKRVVLTQQPLGASFLRIQLWLNISTFNLTLLGCHLRKK